MSDTETSAAADEPKPRKKRAVKEAKKKKAAKKVAKGKKVKAKGKGKQRNGTQMALLKGLMTRASGTDRPEALGKLGWKAISFQDNAKMLGLSLRVDKKVKPFRYYGTEKAGKKTA